MKFVLTSIGLVLPMLGVWHRGGAGARGLRPRVGVLDGGLVGADEWEGASLVRGGSSTLTGGGRADTLNVARLRIHEVSALEVQREIDQSDHHGNFDERPDDGGEGGAGVDAEDGDGHGD